MSELLFDAPKSESSQAEASALGRILAVIDPCARFTERESSVGAAWAIDTVTQVRTRVYRVARNIVANDENRFFIDTRVAIIF